MMLTTTMLRVVRVLDDAPEMSATTLALVAGVPPTTLSDALRDKRYLGSEKEARVYTVAKRCADILDALRPLSIPKGDWQTLKTLYESASSPHEISEAITALFEKIDAPTDATGAVVNDALAKGI